MRKRKYSWGIVPVIGAVACMAHGQILLDNGDFEKSQGGRPAGWTPRDRNSIWVSGAGVAGSHAISSRGDGKISTGWISSSLPLAPNTCYRFNFRCRADQAAGGTVTSGSSCCNVDIGVPPKDWNEYSNIFVTPSSAAKPVNEQIHMGQWSLSGQVFFDNAKLVQVLPVYASAQGLILGDGEELDGNNYRFSAPLNSRCRNHSRPLSSFTGCSLNTDRWCLGQNSSLIYRHEVAGRKWKEATLSIGCGYYSGGSVSVAVSADQKNWKPLGAISGKSGFEKKIPAELLASDTVYVRILGEKSCSLQLSSYSWKGVVTGAPASLRGTTSYLEIVRNSATLPITVRKVGDILPGGDNTVELRVENKTGAAYEGTAKIAFTSKEKAPVVQTLPIRFPNAGAYDLELPYVPPSGGEWKMEIAVGTNFLSRSDIFIPRLYDDSYGELLPVSHPKLNLWRASSGWKIPRYRALPKKFVKSLSLRTARNEAETVQLVVTPNEDLHGVKVVAGDLRCGNNILPAKQIDIFRVGYVNVERPTDSTGCRGEWPDPLPRQEGDLTVRAGSNQPFWVRVFASKETPAGIYRGNVTVQADGGISLRVPLFAEVFDFTMPDRMTCESAFGLGAYRIFQYHNLKTPAQRKDMYDRYLRLLSKSHITPYRATALAPLTYHVEGLGDWSGSGKIVEDDKFSGKGCVKITDDNPHTNASWCYGKKIPYPQNDIHISFRYKAEKDQPFIVSFGSFDAAGNWISGNNRDFYVPGKKTAWTKHEFVYPVTGFPKGAKTFSFVIFPAGWQDKGERTGTIFVDDLKVTDSATGKPLVKGGDFEPVNIDNVEVVFDWAAWDKATAYALDELHFTCFSMPVAGLGGGTFAARTEPSFNGFPGGSREYEILMSKYLGGIESHLREKGWLGKAYVYWFDEPSEKDYEFVMNGFNTLKRHAPGLRRLLTEQPEKELAGGPNLWVPLTPSLHVEEEANRRAAGDQFWWYVCCGPRAPFVTEFIDHPGSEMRLWLWQTWGENVSGILLWETVWWTSACAYPDPKNPQNPYEDPMSWVSGYSTPKGAKQPWGNGDGRFIYPPTAAANGRPEKPVLEDPITSYRLEMLREGMEDYEYFAILKRLLEEKGSKLSTDARKHYTELLRVPKNVYASLTEFTVDPAPMEAHREKLARAIVELLKLK